MERERKAREEESSSKTHEGLWQQESVKSAKQTVQRKRRGRERYLQTERKRKWGNTALEGSEGIEKAWKLVIAIWMCWESGLHINKHKHTLTFTLTHWHTPTHTHAQLLQRAFLICLFLGPVSEYRVECRVRGEGHQEKMLLGRTTTLTSLFSLIASFCFSAPVHPPHSSPAPPPGPVPEASWIKLLRIRIMTGENEDRYPREATTVLVWPLVLSHLGNTNSWWHYGSLPAIKYM